MSAVLYLVYAAIFAVLYAVFYFFCLTYRPKKPNNILGGPRLNKFKQQTVEVRTDKDHGEGAVRRSIEGPPGDQPLPYVIEEGKKTLTTQYETFEYAVQTYGKSYNCLGSREVLPGGRRGDYVWKNYIEVQQIRDALRRGLVDLGLEPGDCVGIFSKNREEWVIVEQACYANSFVIVSFYDTLGPDAVQFIASHCEAKAVICANENLDALMSVVSHCPNLKFVVHFDPLTNIPDATLRSYSKIKLYYYQDIITAGHRPELVKNTKFDAVPPKPTDLSTIMYTSGTTGDPKGVLLTHQNIVSMMNCCKIRVEDLVAPGDCYLSYLPLAHILERMVTSMAIYKGVAIGMFSGDVKLLKNDLEVLKPTLFCGVPRVFERIFDQINQRVSGGTPLRKFLFSRALLSSTTANLLNKEPPLFYSALVLNKLKAVLGGRVRVMLSGGAPLSPHIHQFLITAFRTPLVQAYGLTETCAGATIAFPKDNQGSIGHVGPPVYCCEIKLIDIPDMGYKTSDTPCSRGEVLIKGPMVSSGYYKDAGKTQESFRDGWFHTGDVGRWNVDGTLSIIDRKKNIFKLSHGEYIAVEKLEGVYSNADGVEQIWVYGESTKSSLVAIVVSKDKGKEKKEEMMKQLEEAGKKGGLKGFERIGNVRFAEEEFTEKNNLATPTLKLKRQQLQQKYQKEIDEMYEELESGSGSGGKKKD